MTVPKCTETLRSKTQNIQSFNLNFKNNFYTARLSIRDFLTRYFFSVQTVVYIETKSKGTLKAGKRILVQTISMLNEIKKNTTTKK